MLTAVRLFYLAHFQDCSIGRMCVCPLALENLQNIVSFTIYRPFNISCRIRSPFMVRSKDFDQSVYIHIQLIHSQYLRHLPPRSLFARHNWPRARGRRFPWAPATVPFPFPRACAWSAGFGTRLSPEIKGPFINHWVL